MTELEKLWMPLVATIVAFGIAIGLSYIGIEIGAVGWMIIAFVTYFVILVLRVRNS